MHSGSSHRFVIVSPSLELLEDTAITIRDGIRLELEMAVHLQRRSNPSHGDEVPPRRRLSSVWLLICDMGIGHVRCRVRLLL